MNNSEQDTPPSRRRFRISVAGRLDKRFIEGNDEIELGHSTAGSTLDGAFIDESHLRGMLDGLWQLGIEVLGFETYHADRDEQGTAENEEQSPPAEGDETNLKT